MAYFSIPIEVDPAAVAAGIRDRLRALVPGFDPQPGSLTWLLIDEVAVEVASNREQASEWDEAAFSRLGELYNLPLPEATYATGDTTWSFFDSVERTIEAGTPLTILSSDGTSRVGFEVAADVIRGAGQQEVPVPIVATEPGAVASGLSLSPALEQDLAQVQTITVVGVTTGGTDAMPFEEHLERLVEEFQLQARTLIRPEDFVTAARRVPGVTRAVAVNGYDATNDSYDNVGIFTVFLDAGGVDVATAVFAAVEAEFETRRLINLTVRLANPKRTQVEVTWSAIARPGFDLEALRLAGDEALLSFLDPATWGSAPDPLVWENEPMVRVNHLVAALENVDGIRYVPPGAVKINGGTVDVALGSPVGVPEVMAVTGTVTAS